MKRVEDYTNFKNADVISTSPFRNRCRSCSSSLCSSSSKLLGIHRYRCQNESGLCDRPVFDLEGLMNSP